FLDLDVWNRHELNSERMTEWLGTLVELGPDKLLSATRELDPELLALWVSRHATIYDLTLEEDAPEDTTNPLLQTPDRYFVIEITATGDEARTVERFLDLLYRADMDSARKLLMAARSEPASELEEMGYRWRSGRMADLGFVDYYEALE